MHSSPPSVVVPGFEGQLPALQPGCGGPHPRTDLRGRLSVRVPTLAEQPARNREGLGVTEPRLSVPFWYFLQSCPPHFPACQPLLPVLPRLRSPGPLPARSPKCESLLPSPVSSAWEPAPTPSLPGCYSGIWAGYSGVCSPAWQTKAREARWRRYRDL